MERLRVGRSEGPSGCGEQESGPDLVDGDALVMEILGEPSVGGTGTSAGAGSVSIEVEDESDEVIAGETVHEPVRFAAGGLKSSK